MGVSRDALWRMLRTLGATCLVATLALFQACGSGVDKDRTPTAIPTPPAPSAASFSGDGGGADGTTVFIDSAPDQDLVSGGLVLNVNVENASNLGAFQLVLSFDPDQVRLQGVHETGFLGSSGREPYCLDPTIDQGFVQFNCVTLGSSPGGVDGGGVLAEVRLVPLMVGDSALSLARVKLATPDGSELPQSAPAAGGTLHVR